MEEKYQGKRATTCLQLEGDSDWIKLEGTENDIRKENEFCII